MKKLIDFFTGKFPVKYYATIDIFCILFNVTMYRVFHSKGYLLLAVLFCLLLLFKYFNSILFRRK